MDPALGDLALAEARDALAQGDWVPARELLAATRGRAASGAVVAGEAPVAGGATGGPAAPRWDRRSHRVRVLAEAVANSAWVERWQVLDPVNPDAALLRAEVETIRALRTAVTGGAGRQETVAEALKWCRHAAELAPEDPTPWVVMVTLSRAADRGSGTAGSRPVGRDEFWRRWQEMRARDPLNRDGHHEALAYLYQAWCGSHAEMYDFAYWLAGEAPVGSPLAVLPLVAHAEVYRATAEAVVQGGGAKPSPYEHWSRPQVVADIERVLRSWLGSATVPHAQADLDRNYLLHAIVFSGRADTAEARGLYDAIGSHAVRAPWGFTGDTETSFLYWRDRAFGGGTPRR